MIYLLVFFGLGLVFESEQREHKPIESLTLQKNIMRQVTTKEKSLHCESLSSAPAKTFYEKPINRILGRYTVAWETAEEKVCVRSRLRLRDFEGNLCDPMVVRNVPNMVATYLESRKASILKNPIPFIVYEAIDFLDSLIVPEMKVLEFGSGNSSLWFLSKQCHLTSIEHSKPWMDEVEAYVETHKNLYDVDTLKEFKYLQIEGQETLDFVAQEEEESYDIVLVDSSVAHNNRNHCLQAALSKLKKGGWMVLDNSDHPNNWPAQNFMNERFERTRFTGLMPMGLTVSQTSFWQKR